MNVSAAWAFCGVSFKGSKTISATTLQWSYWIFDSRVGVITCLPWIIELSMRQAGRSVFGTSMASRSLTPPVVTQSILLHTLTGLQKTSLLNWIANHWPKKAENQRCYRERPFKQIQVQAHAACRKAIHVDHKAERSQFKYAAKLTWYSPHKMCSRWKALYIFHQPLGLDGKSIWGFLGLFLEFVSQPPN